MRTVQYIIEGTVTAIVLAWVVTHSAQFGSVTTAVRKATVGGVQALWGPNTG